MRNIAPIEYALLAIITFIAAILLFSHINNAVRYDSCLKELTQLLKGDISQAQTSCKIAMNMREGK